MKTRLITTSVLLAAMFIGTSCSKDTDSGAPEEVGTKTVTIKFDQAEAVESRGVDIPKIALASGIYDAYFLFLDATGNVLKTFVFDPAPLGTKFTVPSTVTKIYVMANVKASGAVYPQDNAVVGKPIATAKSLVKIQAKSQTITIAANIPAGKTSAEKVVLESVVTDIPTGDNPTVAVTIKPIVARMELSSIKVTGVTEAIKITGIFIGNFYESYNMSTGAFASFAVANNNPATQAPYIASYPRAGEGTGDPVLPTTYNADFRTVAGSGANPGKDKKWAYQVFPASSAATLPRIIIKMENVTASGEGQATYPVLYAVVNTYKKGTTAVTAFTAGTVYSISEISIPYDAMVVDPKEENKAMTVNVSAAPWTLENLTPEL